MKFSPVSLLLLYDLIVEIYAGISVQHKKVLSEFKVCSNAVSTFTPYASDSLAQTAIDDFNVALSVDETTTDNYYAWCLLYGCGEFNLEADSWCSTGGNEACLNECVEGQCTSYGIPDCDSDFDVAPTKSTPTSPSNIETSIDLSAYPSTATSGMPSITPQGNRKSSHSSSTSILTMSSTPASPSRQYSSEPTEAVASTGDLSIAPTMVRSPVPSFEWPTSLFMSPHHLSYVTPQADSSKSPDVGQTTSELTSRYDKDLYPSNWREISCGIITVRLSILTEYPTYRGNTIKTSTYSLKKNEDILHSGKNQITAKDILSGNETKLVNNILTSMITVFCHMPESSRYIIIVPTVEENDMAYCDNYTLLMSKDTMQSLYDLNNTILFADSTTGKGGFIDVVDRRFLFATLNDDVEELRWIEWRISFHIINVGHALLQSEGGIINDAIPTIDRGLNKALIKAASTGLVDEIFKSSNSDIISTSLVGSERNAFSSIINEGPSSNDDKIKNLTFNTIIIGSTKKGDNTGVFKVKSIQYVGFVMFISSIVGFTILTKKARYTGEYKEVGNDITRRIPFIITNEGFESDLLIDSPLDYAVPDPAVNLFTQRSEC